MSLLAVRMTITIKQAALGKKVMKKMKKFYSEYNE